MGLLIKIRKSEYEAKMAQAQSLLNNLESVKNKYQTLLSELDSDIVTGEDANFSAAEEMVRQNIKATESAIKEAQKARDSLAESVKLYDEHDAAIQDTLNKGLEAGVNAVKAAVDVQSVL